MTFEEWYPYKSELVNGIGGYLAITAQDRYEHDAEFHSIVDLMHSMIRQAKYTPTELREAALLAAVHYESINMRPWYKANPDGSVTVWVRKFKD